MAKGRRITVEFLGDASDFKRAVGQVEGGAGKIGSALGKVAKVGAAGLAVAGVAAGKFAVDAVGAASDLNETISKSRIIFGKHAKDMEDWADRADTSLGLSKQAALGMTSSFADMFDQIGFGSTRAAQMSVDVAQLSADLGSFNNLETADVADRMASAFRGEYDSLQALIPNINAARVETVALEMTGKTAAKTLTAQEKAAATLAIVQKDGAKAQHDFAETSGSLANQQKILKAQFENVQASIGQKLLPVAVKLFTWFNDKGIPVIQRVWGWLQDKLGPVFERVGGFISKTVVPAVKDLIGRFAGASEGTSKFKKALKDAEPFLNLVKNIVKGLATVFREVLWPIMKKVADVALPALGKALQVVGKWGTWLWNKALQPAFKFILNGIGWLMEKFGAMLKVLGKVPGMGWAKKAGEDLQDMGRKARDAADGIKKIPNGKHVRVTADTRGANAAIGYTARQLQGLQSLASRGIRVAGVTGAGGFFRATGGPVNAFEGYTVGERGPELFIPEQDGRIVPNSALRRAGGGGGGSVTVNFNGLVTDPKAAASEVRRVLLDLKRSNGAELGLA